MEEVIVKHVSGEILFHLKGNEVQTRDIHTDGATGIATFKDSADALRFLGEYLTNTDGPTDEFQRLFPQHCM